MIVAVAEMSPTVRALLLGIAVVLFGLAAVPWLVRPEWIPLGLALVTFVAFWAALAAT